MAFVKGQSGNPAGRPKGIRDRRSALGDKILDSGPEVLAVVIEKALDGDIAAAALIVNRLIAPLRAQAQKVKFEFDPDADVSTQASQVVLAVSKGDIDPDTGRHLLDMLCALVGLRDVETFIAELNRLRDAKKDHIHGGVKEVDSESPTLFN